MVKINPEEKYLIGVSGGPDSIFLLNAVSKIQPKDLIVCHLNYHFRPDSDVDQKIVEQFCEKHHLKLEIKSIPRNFYDDFTSNFESWAREQRYQFFQEIAKKYQIFNLLIAHNQNDLIETYWLQKKRNNLVNHYGLAPISRYQNLQVIRPMLKLKKNQILQYLAQDQISFAFDSTNEDLKYQRNQIRQILNENDFPKYLQEINQANQKLEKEISQAQFYVKNHLMNEELIIDEKLKKFDPMMIQRIIYQFFVFIKKDYLLQNRKRKTLAEIGKRIQNSPKNFWKIQLGDYFLIQDFNHLSLLGRKYCEFKKIVANNYQDLDEVAVFFNWSEIFQAIDEDGQNFPYVITNDFDDYKLKTKYQNQRMNRYLIDQKISYKNRFLKAVVYQERKKIILNKIK